MSLTISYPAPTAGGVPGVYSSQNAKCVLLKGDTAYPMGGYPVTPGAFGVLGGVAAGVPGGVWQQIVGIHIYPKDAMPSAYIPVYDQAFSLATPTIRFIQLPSTPTGPANEVASGTNLSSVAITVEVWGF